LNIAILAIGNEVLCGKIVDTNGASISREIEGLGVKVVHREIVMDDVDDIVLGLMHAYEYADFVITIGGLGPTVDDRTREGVARFFNEELIYDEAIYENIRQYFSRMMRTTPENNKRQAYKFATGQVLSNYNGTAPGLRLDKEGKKIFLLPGPPNEIFPMFESEVKPVIKSLIDEEIDTRSYRLYGIGESSAEEKILHLFDKYATLSIAPYCNISFIDYVVTAKATDVDKLEHFEQEFLGILGKNWVGSAEDEINALVVAKLKELGLTIAVAESCTGGMLASSLIDVAGVSDVFIESFVTYSNESKMKRLGVREATLFQHGAVSEACVSEMAQGMKEKTGADVTIAITGIAGPDGGTDEKPVGLVYIGIALGAKNYVYMCHFSGNRKKIRIRSCDQALYLLHQLLNNQAKM